MHRLDGRLQKGLAKNLIVRKVHVAWFEGKVPDEKESGKVGGQEQALQESVSRVDNWDKG